MHGGRRVQKHATCTPLSRCCYLESAFFRDLDSAVEAHVLVLVKSSVKLMRRFVKPRRKAKSWVRWKSCESNMTSLGRHGGQLGALVRRQQARARIHMPRYGPAQDSHIPGLFSR